MEQKKYLNNVAYCESFFEKYGDNYRGVAWTKKEEDVRKRYRAMLEVIEHNPNGKNIERELSDQKIRLLDFGCGLSHLYEYMLEQGLDDIDYSGLDLSHKFLAASRRKFPYVDYYQPDILDDGTDIPEFDYVVMNGVFTVKQGFSHEEMLEYFQAVVTRLFSRTKIGMAFNVMSKQVDWEREDLFHLPFDVLASFLTKNISRNFTIRHDYGLYEYTTYVYR